MTPSLGDSITWTNPTTNKSVLGTFVGIHGRWSIIETPTESGHLGLRYVHPGDLKPATPESP